MISLFNPKPNIAQKPVVLLILDGYGLAPPSEGNAIVRAKTPNMDNYFKAYPHGELLASGESVGLPANEVGNTEVGHLMLGAGKLILQDLKKINEDIKEGGYYTNKTFIAAAQHAITNNSKFHIMGLVSSGNVHSSLGHMYALLDFAKQQKVPRVFLHLFTDGRDAPPNEGIEIVKKIQDRLNILKIGQIASVSGRYYAMDRDLRWERTEKAYKALVLGKGNIASDPIAAVDASYKASVTDEFIEPTIIAGPQGPQGLIGDGDAVIFFNYRIDRPRQLTMAFTMPTSTFEREKVLSNLYFATMTQYQKNLPVSGVAYTPKVVDLPLSVYLSQNNLKQAHMAESEKERFVKYFFNGLREEPSPGEDWFIVPSPRVETYDKKPEMSIYELVAEYKKVLKKGEHKFFILNFANADMVAHSGNVEATVVAVGHTDKAVGQLVDETLKHDGTIVITADHGNAEDLLTFPDKTFFYTSTEGQVNTDHSNHPVPLIVINNSLKGKAIELDQGALYDVAPIILGLIGLPQPKDMTGRNLLASID